MLIKPAGKNNEDGINYELFFFPNAVYDSGFKNKRIVAVSEASSEALTKSFVISSNHLFTRNHINHTATMKSKRTFIKM